MRHGDVVAHPAQRGADVLRHGHRAVLAARAADGDRHVPLVLVRVPGQHGLEGVDVAVHELAGAREAEEGREESEVEADDEEDEAASKPKRPGRWTAESA